MNKLKLWLFIFFHHLMGFPGGSVVKNLPAVQETRFDPRAGKIPWRRKWQPIPIFLPGKSHGQRSLVGYSPWGWKESNTAEWITLHHLRASVQLGRSVMSDSLWPQGLQHTGLPGYHSSQNLLKLTSIESVVPSSHLILCRPLLLLPAIFPIIRVFSKQSVLHIRWPKYWSFSFSINPSNKY